MGAFVVRLVADFQPSVVSWKQFGWSLLFYTLPLLAVHALEARKDDLAIVLRLPTAVRYSVYGTLIYLILLFGNFAGAQCIYFQF